MVNPAMISTVGSWGGFYYQPTDSHCSSGPSIARVFSEIYRVSRSCIWGFEYFAPELTEVQYRGRGNLLWKGDCAGLMQRQFSDLVEEKYELHAYHDGSGLTDKMYLLRKTGAPK
jgi:hypothetical protein